MIEDYILIRKIKSGDTEAWEKLVNKYYHQIFAYCVRRCMGNRVIAADLTQEAFLKVVENINRYKYSGKFFNYLFTITVNLCNNYYNKKRLTEYEFNEMDIKNSLDNMDTYLIEQESSNQIQSALNSALSRLKHHDFCKE